METGICFVIVGYTLYMSDLSIVRSNFSVSYRLASIVHNELVVEAGSCSIVRDSFLLVIVGLETLSLLCDGGELVNGRLGIAHRGSLLFRVSMRSAILGLEDRTDVWLDGLGWRYVEGPLSSVTIPTYVQFVDMHICDVTRSWKEKDHHVLWTA